MKSPRITLDGNSWDLKMEDGKILWVEDGTQAAQRAFERLMIFKGEPSLDGALTTKTEEGTKWYEIIFNMEKTRAERDLEIKSRILGAPGIDKIIRFDWEQTGNTMTYDADFKTAWGEESVSAEVTFL